MNVVQSPAVDIIIRSLGEEDRLQIQAWFDHLRNWENDPFIRKHAEKLPSAANVYVLKTSNDGWRIIFQLEPDQIKVLDIASKSTIMKFRETA
jgi:mRNA-degrading endonuclease RelE of RelBE toxin-antitoxin system